jgi:hypothetical protein
MKEIQSIQIEDGDDGRVPATDSTSSKGYVVRKLDNPDFVEPFKTEAAFDQFEDSSFDPLVSKVDYVYDYVTQFDDSFMLEDSFPGFTDPNDRANHFGTQTADTIEDFDEAVLLLLPMEAFKHYIAVVVHTDNVTNQFSEIINPAAPAYSSKDPLGTIVADILPMNIGDITYASMNYKCSGQDGTKDWDYHLILDLENETYSGYVAMSDTDGDDVVKINGVLDGTPCTLTVLSGTQGSDLEIAIEANEFSGEWLITALPKIKTITGTTGKKHQYTIQTQ